MAVSFIEMWNPCKGMCLIENNKFNFNYLKVPLISMWRCQVETYIFESTAQARTIVKVYLGSISPLASPPFFRNFPPMLPLAQGDPFSTQGSQQWHLLLVWLTQGYFLLWFITLSTHSPFKRPCFVTVPVDPSSVLSMVRINDKTIC